MSKPLNVLIVDDSGDDVLLLARELRRGDYDPCCFRVETTGEMYQALDRGAWDIILADYALSQFSGPEALKLAKERGLDLPFVLVSGKIGEETAVELMKCGAHDFIMKSNLTRLNSVVARELREAENRRQKRLADQALRENQQRLELALKGGDLGLWDINFKTQSMSINERYAEMLGYFSGEIQPIHDTFFDLMHPEDRARTREGMIAHANGQMPFYDVEYRLKCKRGDWKWVLSRGQVVERDENGKPVRAVGTHLDITERKRAVEAIKASGEFNKAIVDHSPLGISVRNRNGKLLSCNKAWQKIWNKTDQEVMEFLAAEPQMLQFDHKDDYLEDWQPKVREIYEKGGYLHVPEVKQIYHYESGEHWVSQFFYALKNSDGQVEKVVILTEDITERKRAEQALSEEALRRRILMEQSRDGIVVLDVDGKVYEANQRYAEMLGYSPEEVLGLHVWDWDYQWPREKLLEMLRVVDEKGDHFETRHRRKDGGVFDVEISTNGAICGNQKLIFCVCRDITERKQAEEETRKSSARYRELFDSVIEGIAFVDSEEIVRMCNPAFARIYDCDKPEDLLGRSLLDFVSEGRKGLLFEQTDSRKRNESSSYELDIVTARGNSKTLLISASPRFDQDGNFLGSFGTTIDISRRKKAEEALRKLNEELEEKVRERTVRLLESEEKARKLIMHAPTFIYEVDFRGPRLTMVNDMMCEYIGYTREELLAMNPMDFLDEKGKVKFQDRVKKWLNGEKPDDDVEYNMRTKQGRVIHAVLHATFTTENGKPVGAMVIGHDITERKRLEETLENRVSERTAALKASEERYRTIVESVSESIWLIDGTGKIVYVNHQAADMLGFASEEIIGRPLISFMPPEAAKVTEERLMHRQPNKVRRETSLLHRDGSVVYVDVSAAPLCDANGIYTGALAVVTDITERKKNETQGKARYELLNRLRIVKTVSECLSAGCEIARDWGKFKKAVFIFRNGEHGEVNFGQTGMLKNEIAGIAPNSMPGREFIEKIGGDKNRLGQSYYIPGEEIGGLGKTPMVIAPETVIDQDNKSSSMGGLLIAPAKGAQGEFDGLFSISIPAGIGMPKEEDVRFIEEIVDIVSGRARELRYEKQQAADRKKLEEKNITLREILAGIEHEKLEAKKQLAQAVTQTLIPSFNKLVKRDGKINKAYYNIHKKTLEEFARATGSVLPLGSKLSPRELEICAMIKNGASSKEIAESLDIALTTVQKHRELIRKKLGLANRKLNLTSYLRSL